MKTYEKIVKIVSIVMGVILTVLLYSIGPTTRASFSGNTPTVEDYQVLKNYAIEIARGSDVDLPENVNVTKSINEESFMLSVDTSLYGIEANFPLQYSDKFENGMIKCDGILDFENVSYSEHTEIQPRWFYCMCFLIPVCMFIIILYGIFYGLPYLFLKLIRFVTKKNLMDSKI